MSIFYRHRIIRCQFIKLLPAKAAPLGLSVDSVKPKLLGYIYGIKRLFRVDHSFLVKFE